MTERATQRPKGFRKPKHWDDTPAPKPAPVKDDETLSPTRFGDWEKNGIAIDF